MAGFDESDRGRKEGAGTIRAKHFSEYRIHFLKGAPYEDAITQIRKTLELDSNNRSRTLDWWCLIANAVASEARAEFQTARRWMTCNGMRSLGYAARLGDRDQSRAICASWKSWQSRICLRTRTGDRLSGIGEHEKSFGLAGESIEDSFFFCLPRPHLLWWIKGDQLYDSVRKEQRLRRLLKKLRTRSIAPWQRSQTAEIRTRASGSRAGSGSRS